MGSCISRQSSPTPTRSSVHLSHDHSSSSTTSSRVGERISRDYDAEGDDDWTELEDELTWDTVLLKEWVSNAESVFIDKVDVIYSNNYSPSQLHRLENISKNDEGWLQLVASLISTVNSMARNRFSSNHYAGPTFIMLLLEGAPLPSRQLVERMVSMVTPIMESTIHNPVDDVSLIMQRNICVVYAFIADRMAGSISSLLMTPSLANFLERTIRENINPSLTLFALQCLEKLSLTKENKDYLNKNHNFSKILSELGGTVVPFSRVYHLSPSELIAYQCSFLAEWLLDNVFLKKARKLTYKTVDYAKLGAIISAKDKTDSAKVAPNGLSIRCDTCTFECARGTYGVSSGVHYYETVLLTNGIMQIGWATKESDFRIDYGEGVGDDKSSIAFDGCRNYIWHQSCSYKHNLPAWKVGDVLGCLIDFNQRQFIFYLNGKKAELVKQDKLDFYFSSSPYYPAVSLMAYQQCYFNFGQTAFMFAPKKLSPLANLNDLALPHVNRDEMTVVPLHIQRQSQQSQSLSFSLSSSKKLECKICCDHEANARMKPCDHHICDNCVKQMSSQCPFCRTEFINYEVI